MTQHLPRNILQAEEDFFNKSKVKVVSGNKVRCGEIFISDIPEFVEFDWFERNYTLMMNNILKRIISTEVPFPGYSNGKRAIRALTDKFKKEFRNCIHPDTNTGRMLKNKDIGTVICMVSVSGVDVSTFEGAYAVEFHWKAEYLRNGEVKQKPIIHCYNSQTDRRVEC